jgi:hypothetical protein
MSVWNHDCCCKLCYINGGLHLIAWDSAKNDSLVFAIGGIRFVHLTNRRFNWLYGFAFWTEQAGIAICVE